MNRPDRRCPTCDGTGIVDWNLAPGGQRIAVPCWCCIPTHYVGTAA